MRQVISAAPTIDVSALARRLAAGGPVMGDPAREACERYGFQTLYEFPPALQKQVRRELIRKHAQALGGDGAMVFDHSVFAMLADWMRWLWSETTTEEWEAVLEEARPAADRAEVIHHVVDGPASLYDGYRWLDPRNAAQVERIMRSLYRELGCEARVKETRA